MRGRRGDGRRWLRGNEEGGNCRGGRDYGYVEDHVRNLRSFTCQEWIDELSQRAAERICEGSDRGSGDAARGREPEV